MRVESVGAVTADDIRGCYEGLANESWIRPGMRFLADNHALSDVPPNPEFAGTAFADVRRAFVLTAARVAVLVFNALEYGTTRHSSPC